MQKSRKNAHLNFTIGTNEFCDYRIWLKAAANLSVCKDQGGCAVIYNEQRKQEERDNLELRNLKISRREAHWAIALAIISICASQFWGHTIFEWTWIAMQKISKLLF